MGGSCGFVVITSYQFYDVGAIVVASGKSKDLQSKQLDNSIKKKMYIRLAIVPSLYVISIGLSFFNFDVAIIFPVIMIPSLILVAKAHR